MGNNPSKFPKGDNYPVENVSWNDVRDFIRKLNRQTDGRFRLPTEAEWEFACRGGGKPRKYSFAFGRLSSSKANYNKQVGSTTPVNRFPENELGLYGMSGNVLEWVQNIYNSEAYRKTSGDNPHYQGPGKRRAVRDGGWDYAGRYIRCSNRGNVSPTYKDNSVGFRLARTP